MKLIGGLMAILFGVVIASLWVVQYIWIDKEQFPMSRMPSWKIEFLKAAHFIPWPSSNELHLDRTIKLSSAILHQEGDRSLKDLLSKFNEALYLLNHDADHNDLTLYPDLAYERLINQVTLMHRGAYFLIKAGRQVEIEASFNQLEPTFRRLASPTMAERVGFSVEKMLHEVILYHDVQRAKETRDSLIATLPEESSAGAWQAVVNLYYGYALCQSKNQEGAEYIQTSIGYLTRNVLIELAAANWDTGLLSGIVLINQDDSACKNAVESVLSVIKY